MHVLMSRCVNLCGSHEVTQDRGYWMGEWGGWVGGSRAEAKQCWPVNSSDYFSSMLVMAVSSSPTSDTTHFHTCLTGGFPEAVLLLDLLEGVGWV